MNQLKNKTYILLRQVPRGRVTTYKELARAAGTTAYRAIGQILRRNPDAPNTPCHRVVTSKGTIGGFMGATSSAKIVKKKQLLQSEGIVFDGNRVVDFEKILFRFK